MRKLVSPDDWRAAARRCLPKVVFDYVDGGAEEETTLRANRDAFSSLLFRPRGAVPAADIELTTTVAGSVVSMPVLLAPCGMASLVRPHGDRLAASAAARAGTVFVLSTMSGDSVQEVVRAAGSQFAWYQVYRVGTHYDALRAVERARDSGVGGLVVTIDTAVVSMRTRDCRNGGLAIVNSSLWRALPVLPDLLAAPGWLARQLASGQLPPRLMNVPGNDGRPCRLGRNIPPVSLTWGEIDRVRERFSGPLIVKGVMTAEDACRSLDVGASAVVVSNHGGRQLDGAPATAAVLPEVVDAVGERAEVLVDGGIRRGSDVARALALGATAVLIGRPYLYGLAVDGQRGVEAIVDVLATELRRTLRLLGCPSVRALDRSWLRTGTARPPR
jgi:isopentenyl diphosphate isomerase/L-lactate dehydrogenase-like FMN-dependent dehydrogenase